MSNSVKHIQFLISELLEETLNSNNSTLLTEVVLTGLRELENRAKVASQEIEKIEKNEELLAYNQTLSKQLAEESNLKIEALKTELIELVHQIEHRDDAILRLQNQNDQQKRDLSKRSSDIKCITDTANSLKYIPIYKSRKKISNLKEELESAKRKLQKKESALLKHKHERTSVVQYIEEIGHHESHKSNEIDDLRNLVNSLKEEIRGLKEEHESELENIAANHRLTLITNL